MEQDNHGLEAGSDASANVSHVKEPICTRLSDMIFFTEHVSDVEQVLQETSFRRQQDLFRQRAVTYLPTWAYEEEPLNHAEASDMGGVAPARNLCLAGTALIWLFFVVFSFMACTLAVCDENGFVRVPFWLIGIYPPFLLIHIYLEWKVLRYTVVAQAMCTAPFKVGPFKVQYVIWLLVSLSMSIVGHMDITTSAIVIASAFKSGECRSAHVWNPSEIWKQTMNQSVMKSIPLLSNLSIVFLFSGGMLACQPLYSLFCAIPLKGQAEGIFDTCLQSKQTVPGSIIQLAELSRMAAITTQDAPYLACASRNWRPSVICGHLQRIITKFVLLSIIEVAIQTNLQASLRGVNKAVEVLHHNNDKEDWLILFSFILSCLFAFYGLWQTYQKVSMLYSSLKYAASLMGVGDRSDAATQEPMLGNPLETIPTCKYSGTMLPVFHYSLGERRTQMECKQSENCRTKPLNPENYKDVPLLNVCKAALMCVKDSGQDVQHSDPTRWLNDFWTLVVKLREVKPSDLSEDSKKELRLMLDSGELNPMVLDKHSHASSLVASYVESLLEKADYDEQLREYDARCEMCKEEARHHLTKGHVLYCSFYAVVSLYVLLLGYAVIKQGMVARCKYGVWNLLGCADFDAAQSSAVDD